MSTEHATGDPVISKISKLNFEGIDGDGTNRGLNGEEGIVGVANPPTFILAPTAKEEVVNDRIATKEQVEELKTELDSELEKLSKHKFLIRLNEESIDYLIDFIEHKAKWKFRNAYGIVECFDVLNKAKEESIKNKTNGIYIDNIALEAIAYFLHQHEDVGLSYAREYISVIDQVFVVMQEASKWKTRIEVLRKKYILYDNSYQLKVAIEEVDTEALDGKYDPQEAE